MFLPTHCTSHRYSPYTTAGCRDNTIAYAWIQASALLWRSGGIEQRTILFIAQVIVIFIADQWAGYGHFRNESKITSKTNRWKTKIIRNSRDRNKMDLWYALQSVQKRFSVEFTLTFLNISFVSDASQWWWCLLLLLIFFISVVAKTDASVVALRDLFPISIFALFCVFAVGIDS